MRTLRTLAIAALFAPALHAQQTAKIPIRTVATVGSTKDVGLPGGVRQFANGSVLVNDSRGHRLMLFDSTLTRFEVTADSEGAGAARYPFSFQSTFVFYYLGDSAIFTDQTTQTFVVIGPDGKLGRTMALPRPRDMTTLSAPVRGNPGFDERGRFYYIGNANAGSRLTPGQTRFADTLNVVRADFDTRSVDSIGKMTRPVMSSPPIERDANGKASMKIIINPIPVAPDGWAVLTDGSLGIVRAHDYHVDWLYADGTQASTPKMPFDWRRLTDADKQAKIDSIKHIIDSVRASGKIYNMTITSSRANPEKPDTIAPAIEFGPLSEMLDYVPALRNGSVTSDRDNHLWILPTTTLSAAGGGLLYDVVNRQGEIIERVQLPARRFISGFGPGGIVYLSAGDRTVGFTLERVRIVR